METADFRKLKYGQVVRDVVSGHHHIVQHVVRDPDGNAVYVGLLPAMTEAAASRVEMVNAAHGETFIEGNVLKGRTVQP